MRLLLFILMIAASSALAQSNLVFSLSQASQPGIGSNAVAFAGTLINESPTNLYLNNIQFAFIGAATNNLGSGSNAFFMNVPGILLPGESYKDVVFSVTVNPGAPPGDYFGSVTIQGGTNIFAVSNLATQTFLITSQDTLGDGIPDWWRQQYFGSGTTTNAQSCATCDADGTGQNNLFKYVAGLVPTNPASVFVLGMLGFSNAPSPYNAVLNFSPAVAGRSYVVQSSSNLLTSDWVPLAGAVAVTAPTPSNSITILDTTAAQALKFYRVQISLP